MRFLKLLIGITFLAVPHCVFGQYVQSSDTLLDHMAGKWLLKGTIAGGRVEHDITAAWVLGHQYIEIKETSREKQADGTPVYEATVFISRDKSRNQYDCLWLDNTSNSGLSNEIIAHADVKPNVIAFLFKINAKSYFHTTLTYNTADDSWHWHMTDDENGKLEVFADAVMSKSP